MQCFTKANLIYLHILHVLGFTNSGNIRKHKSISKKDSLYNKWHESTKIYIHDERQKICLNIIDK